MADNSKFIQTQTFKLAGGGISLSDTSISLQSFKFPDGTAITMSHIGSLCSGTIEPGASKEEIISFTGVTQNGDGSATLTGVTRGLKFGDTAGDYGQDLSLRKSHAGNTTFVITNNPQFYNKFPAKDNDEVITGDWQVPAPAAGASVVNKDYVDAAIGGGVGTATDTTFGTVKGTKNQGSKPKVISALVREQATPDKTLKVESFRQTFIDKIVAYAGGDTPNFIDPAMGGDLGFALTPSNGETITITVDGTACVFTAVTTIGATPGNFLIGGSAAVARANFTALVNNPTVTSANQVAFSGAQLTAIQKLSATDDLALNTFVRVTNPATATFSVVETMAGAGNIWTINSTKNRYDLVVVDNAGTLQIRKGSEAVSPTVPTPTSGDLTLALILNRVGMTTVRDTDVSGQGYIVELYTPSIYRTDLLTSSSLSSIVKFGGTGTDGALAVSSGTTNIDLGSVAVFIKNYTSISITGTGKITFTNPHANGTAIIFKSQGAVTLTSSQAPMIDASALGAAGGASIVSNTATAGNAGTNGAFMLISTGAGGAGPSSGSPANAGNAGVLSIAGYSYTITKQKYSLVPVAAGGGSGGTDGGGGSSCTSGAGGRGGATLIIECAGAWNFTTASGISVAGQSGGTAAEAGTSVGGGGGGGGGGFFLGLYNTLTANSGTVTVSGGIGGNAGSIFSGGSKRGGGGGALISAGTTGTGTTTASAKTGGDGALGFSSIGLNTEFA